MSIEGENLPTNDDDFAEEEQFFRDLDALCRDEFVDGLDDEWDSRETGRPIIDLVEVVQVLEELNAVYQVKRLSEDELADLLDTEEEYYFICDDFYGARASLMSVELLERAEVCIQALHRLPAWHQDTSEPPEAQEVPEHTDAPKQKELSLLRENGYYAVGIPHQINEIGTPYNRTLDIVLLLSELMQREGKPVCLLVANMPTDTRSAEEARLIGLKDLIFYEALQDLLLADGAS